MLDIAVILTCYNRKQNTVDCLRKLFQNKGINQSFSISVFLVDDGSTDGTSDAVKHHFPSVNIILGNGNLFWNRGMHLAWTTAAKHKNYDFYLWLNDDTELFDAAIEEMLACYKQGGQKSIICGVTSSKQTGNITYGGIDTFGKLILPNKAIQSCATINGNVVLVSKLAFEEVGFNDPLFLHAIGDFDYGFRAIKKGFTIFITKTYIANCEANKNLPKWCLTSTPIKKRLQSLYSPLGNSHPYYYFIYEYRHYGIFTALKHFFSIHLRVLIPSLWKQ